MKTTMVRDLGILLSFAAATALAGSISVTDEIRYPTSYREQSVSDMIDSSFRVPIPDSFETRRVGSNMDVPTLGVVSRPVVVRNQSPTYHVLFADGREAQFVDGQTIVVGGVPYRGLGVRSGYYRVLNLNTSDILLFRMPRHAAS
jgi:hypothetical protein